MYRTTTLLLLTCLASAALDSLHAQQRRPGHTGVISNNQPIAGNWNDATTYDELGYYNITTGAFVLCDGNVGNPIDCKTFRAPTWSGGGSPSPKVPLAGRWAHDSRDTRDGVGLYDPQSGRVELFWLIGRSNCGVDCISGLMLYRSFVLGAGGDAPVVGDWDASGVDSLALLHPHGAVTFFDDTNIVPWALLNLGYDTSDMVPIAGQWATDGGVSAYDSLGLYITQKKTLIVFDGMEQQEQIQFSVRTDGTVPLSVRWSTFPASSPALYYQRRTVIACQMGLPCHEVERFPNNFRAIFLESGEDIDGTLDSRFPNDPIGG